MLIKEMKGRGNLAFNKKIKIKFDSYKKINEEE